MGSVLYVFPDGRTGLGLLILRAVVAGSGLAIANAADLHHGWSLAHCLMIAVPLAAGFRTRTLAVLGAVILPLAFAQGIGLATLALHAGCSAALCLTGPGAWSIDSAIFGRRQIILPNLDDAV